MHGRHFGFEPHRHATQDMRASDKKWRRKVKEARAEKESLRSELAGRLALLADRMTQLASKEARHETHQRKPSTWRLYVSSLFCLYFPTAASYITLNRPAIS